MQRLLTLQKFNDRGLLWPRPILPSAKLFCNGIGRKRLAYVLKPRNGFDVFEEARDRRIVTALGFHG